MTNEALIERADMYQEMNERLGKVRKKSREYELTFFPRHINIMYKIIISTFH